MAVEREHGVGSGLDLAADAARQMHAEERELRVGNRIDEAFDQVAALRRELEVLAAERNDPHPGVVAGHPRDAVALKPAAVDERRGRDRAAGGLEHQPVPLRDGSRSDDGRA